MWVNLVIDEQKEEICRLTKMGLHTTEKMKGAIGFGCALHSSNADCLAQCHTWMADARLALFYFGMTNPCPDHAETRPAASCGFLDCYLCAPLSLSLSLLCLSSSFLFSTFVAIKREVLQTAVRRVDINQPRLERAKLFLFMKVVLIYILI